MRKSLGRALVLLVVSVAWAAPADAQIEEVILSIDGMTWQLCAVQAERALRHLEGVAAVRVMLAEKSATVTLKKDSPLEPDRFRTAIQGASQQVRVFELSLRATVDRQDGRYYLRLPGSSPRFAIRGGASDKRVVALVGKEVRARARLVSFVAPFDLELMDITRP